jgi:RNA polymerase sigma-70 factor (sigma-E family)
LATTVLTRAEPTRATAARFGEIRPEQRRDVPSRTHVETLLPATFSRVRRVNKGVALSPADVVAVDEPEPVVPLDAGFDDFVRQRSQALCRAAFLLTGDRHLAEDLVQTALAKLYGRWHRITANGDPGPYVRTVVVRQAIAWRRRRWHGEVPTSPLPETGTTDPGSALDRRGRLHEALGRLPARQRAAVVLRFYEDLSEAETAAAMGCSVGTVKSQTAKGLTRLRAALGDAPTGPGTEDSDA